MHLFKVDVLTPQSTEDVGHHFKLDVTDTASVVCLQTDSHGLGAADGHVGGGGHVDGASEGDLEGGLERRLVQAGERLARVRRLELRHRQPSEGTPGQRGQRVQRRSAEVSTGQRRSSEGTPGRPGVSTGQRGSE